MKYAIIKTNDKTIKHYVENYDQFIDYVINYINVNKNIYNKNIYNENVNGNVNEHVNIIKNINNYTITDFIDNIKNDANIDNGMYIIINDELSQEKNNITLIEKCTIIDTGYVYNSTRNEIYIKDIWELYYNDAIENKINYNHVPFLNKFYLSLLVENPRIYLMGNDFYEKVESAHKIIDYICDNNIVDESNIKIYDNNEKNIKLWKDKYVKCEICTKNINQNLQCIINQQKMFKYANRSQNNMIVIVVHITICDDIDKSLFNEINMNTHIYNISLLLIIDNYANRNCVFQNNIDHIIIHNRPVDINESLENKTDTTIDLININMDVDIDKLIIDSDMIVHEPNNFNIDHFYIYEYYATYFPNFSLFKNTLDFYGNIVIMLQGNSIIEKTYYF